MANPTATIRELRTSFRSVKRKIEEHGEIVITDHGVPAYVLKTLPPQIVIRKSPVDYYARLIKTQPKPISHEAMNQFWEEERGDR